MINHPIGENSPLVNPTILPLHSVTTIATDSVLVVAPHPDDETLGCGGAIALLRRLGCTVQVLVMSDGTRSHPHSRKYPAPALKALREAETLCAMTLLGVESSAVTFLQLPDGAIPTPESVDSQDAIAKCRAYLEAFTPKIIFLPWRYDPHSDHRATWQLIRAALLPLPDQPRIIEYPIWDWDEQQRGDLSEAQLLTAWRLDIQQVLTLKQKAIAAYRSQITDLIDDDPEGFRLTPEMLANFAHPWEVYLEVG